MTTKSNLNSLIADIMKDLPTLPLNILNEMYQRMNQLVHCGQENWNFQNLNFYNSSEKLDFMKSNLIDTTGFSFAGFYGVIDASRHAFYQQFGDKPYMSTIALPSNDLGRRILQSFTESDKREVIFVHSVLYSHGVHMEKILLSKKSRLNEAREFIPEYVAEAMIDSDIKEFKIIGENKSAI